MRTQQKSDTLGAENTDILQNKCEDSECQGTTDYTVTIKKDSRCSFKSESCEKCGKKQHDGKIWKLLFQVNLVILHK